jgi:hypothetical protein
MEYVAFSVSRQGAISENGGSSASVNGRSVATTPAIAMSTVPKVWFLLGDKAGGRHGARSRAFVSSSVLDANG